MRSVLEPAYLALIVVAAASGEAFDEDGGDAYRDRLQKALDDFE